MTVPRRTTLDLEHQTSCSRGTVELRFTPPRSRWIARTQARRCACWPACSPRRPSRPSCTVTPALTAGRWSGSPTRCARWAPRFERRTGTRRSCTAARHAAADPRSRAVSALSASSACARGTVPPSGRHQGGRPNGREHIPDIDLKDRIPEHVCHHRACRRPLLPAEHVTHSRHISQRAEEYVRQSAFAPVVLNVFVTRGDLFSGVPPRKIGQLLGKSCRGADQD